MADHRRDYDAGHRRHERDWSDRAGDEVRSWFGDNNARQRRHDEREAPSPRVGDPGPRDDRDGGYYASQAFGSYRTDDRAYHDRYRTERPHEGYRDRDDARYGMRDARYDSYGSRPRYSNGDDAAAEYFRAAREQRDELRRYEAQSPGAGFEERDQHHTGVPPLARERGGYWRQYEGHSQFAGRGPKDYRRSDDRVREEVCDCMTDDPMLDASEITVQVSDGVVALSGTVTSREQKRRAEDVAERISGVKDVTNQLRVVREADGHTHTASRPVAQSETGTPGKSSSTTT